MSYSVLGSYDIVDAEGYDGYVPGVLQLLEKHGAEVVVADFETEALEGTAAGCSACCASSRKRRRETATGGTQIA